MKLLDQSHLVSDLAAFIHALHLTSTESIPHAGAQNSHQGSPLAKRNQETRHALTSLERHIDTHRLTDLWEHAVDTPLWAKDPVLLHGDIHSGNLLFLDGRLHGVIDFGLAGAGDPACDLLVAWTELSAYRRETFFNLLETDEATKLRSKGWALSWAAVALAYHRDRNRFLADKARRTLLEVLGDY